MEYIHSIGFQEDDESKGPEIERESKLSDSDFALELHAEELHGIEDASIAHQMSSFLEEETLFDDTVFTVIEHSFIEEHQHQETELQRISLIEELRLQKIAEDQAIAESLQLQEDLSRRQVENDALLAASLASE